MACRRCFAFTSGALFEYDTSKLMHIRNQKIGLIYRLVQLVVIVYIIGYVIVLEKGYQETDTVLSSVTTKMKGVALVQEEGQETRNVWDVADYVVPPEQTDAVFVTTNALVTRNQTRGVCPEDYNVAAGRCTDDSDCQADTPVPNGNGWRTGTCDLTTETCLVYAWCPVENDSNSDSVPSLGNYPLNFTLLIKNNIQFEKFGFYKSNILNATNSTFLQNCTYDSHDPLRRFCPIFRLETMLEEAKVDYNDIALKGGVMGIFIKWECNLDYSSSNCRPQYEFKRLDNANASVAPGYSFRHAINYVVDGVMHRQLTKAYGIRFQILVSGEAGKFSVVPLFLNIGSGIALLGISTVLCDLLVLYVVKRRQYYRDNKYQMIEDEESLLGFVEIKASKKDED